jgi:ABC-2 type transport system ATP-binding protein
MAENLIDARNLTRSFGGRPAVQDLDLTLDRGEILGFLGLNGAGKSTTLRMLAGTLAPSAGRISIAGIDLLSAPKPAKRKLGYLPEQPPLHPELTVSEYLRFCAEIHGVPRPRIRTAVRAVEEKTGLTQVERRLIRNLSRGYQQRVGIAQAILHEPEVLLLDEPTVGLDPAQIQDIRALIRSLGEAHSVIFSSHLLGEVQSLATRVVIIHEGRLAWSRPLVGPGSGIPTVAYRAGLRNPPPVEQLAVRTGAHGVTPLGAGWFRIEPPDGATDEFPRNFLDRAVRDGWAPFGLSAEEASLEAIFLSLTRGETPVPAEPAP